MTWDRRQRPEVDEKVTRPTKPTGDAKGGQRPKVVPIVAPFKTSLGRVNSALREFGRHRGWWV